VECRTAKRRHTLDLRIFRPVQHTGGGNQDICNVCRAVLETQLPAAVHELCAGGLAVEPGEPVDTVFAGGSLKILLDLRTGRQMAGPLGVALEAIGVMVGRHIAGEAGIGVLAPGAADAIGFFINRKVGKAGLAQLDAGENPRHARADHHYFLLSLFHTCRPPA